MRGLGITKGHDPKRKHGWYIRTRKLDGSRPKHYFPNQELRDKAYAIAIRELRTFGALEPLGFADRHAIAEMNRKAAGTGHTALEIFNRGLASLDPKSGTGRGLLPEVAAEHLKEQQARLRDKKISADREREVRYAVNRFCEAAGSIRMADCTRQRLKDYLGELDVGPQTRMNAARNLSFFFNWCVTEGWIAKNPVPAQEGVDRIPVVFTNEEVEQVFAKARPELFAMLAVQWFAGLRPGASHHLRWEDVDFVRGRFMIQPHGNKLRQPDIVGDLPLKVFGMLASVRQASGPITPANYRKWTSELHRELGYKGERRWPEDVARHTFASNLYSLYDLDSRRVEAVLLHSSGAMLRKHYLLKNIPVESAQAYFSGYLPSA